MITPSSFAKIVVYARRRISSAVPASVNLDLSAIDLQPLTWLSIHQASLLLTQSRRNPFGLTLKAFFTPYLAKKIFLTPHPWIFAVFLYSRTPRGKPKSIRPDVHILDSGVSSRVSALYVWPTILLIRTLASCALSLRHWSSGRLEQNPPSC